MWRIVLLLAVGCLAAGMESQFADSLLGDVADNEFITDIGADDDLRNHLDLDNFKEKVGVSYDEWIEHARSLEPSVIEELQQATEQRTEDEIEEDEIISSNEDSRFFKKIGSFFKKNVADPVKKHVIEPVKNVVSKGLNYFKEKAASIAKGMMTKLVEKMQWTPDQYHNFMLRHPKDFTGFALEGDSHDDYQVFEKYADPVNIRVLRHAFSNMPHQDKCDHRRMKWNEWHPSPFAQIAKLPNNPFKVMPFKLQYDKDPKGYFLETCNGISNGQCLQVFKMPEMASKSNCGSATSGYAIDCIDEDHLLQLAVAATPYGSWSMHGSGGRALGGWIDVRGMWVQFYFYYRLLLKNFVHDVNERKKLELAHGCNKQNVPDEYEGIRFVNKDGERLCHLYWARQMKKIITNATTLMTEDTDYAGSLMKGLPDMVESIAAFVFVAVRGIFHDAFPSGVKIYSMIMDKTVAALMAGADDATKKFVNGLIDVLKGTNVVLGFENPIDGGDEVLGILSDFMDYAFYQEQMRYGPGSNLFLSLIPPTAGCTLDPHATSHRKSTRVSARFIKVAKSLPKKLKHPNAMSKFKMCGIKPCGLYPNMALGLGKLISRIQEAFNMFTLNQNDGKKKDLVNARLLIRRIQEKFGTGWPKKGAFVGDKWPKCDCKRDRIEDRCPMTKPPAKTPTRPPRTKPSPSRPPAKTPTDLGKEAAVQSKAARAAAAAAQGAADQAKKAATEATKIAFQLKDLGLQ